MIVTAQKLLFVIPFLFMLLFSNSSSAQIDGIKIGSFDSFSDIGSPLLKGAVTYTEPTQTYRLTASGSNIWFGKDSFSMLWKMMNGDFILQTTIEFQGTGHELHRKTGVMFRKSAAEDAPMVACTVHGDGLTSLQYRSEPGADVREIKMEISGPNVLQLEKKGNNFIMSVANFGEVYQVAQIKNLDLGNDLMAGLFVCAHTNQFSETVNFSNTRIYNTAPDDLVQYKTYLPSLLEIMDVTTGNRNIVASTPDSWQAPNWTPDGKTLIYNAKGLLYNFDIETKKSSVLNTDFAIKNNNDHILSFDGKQIGISHHAQEANGASLIYTVPISGGVPKKVTEQGPSYLHGWSPDQNHLIYTAERNGDYDLFKIAVGGGKEIQLTKSKGLDDGSEYSRDGKFIYFCSTRTGTMQLWRMDANGKNQTQLTFDDLNDWFPHVSPDNNWLVFLSFPKELPADQHPFYQPVYIRMMPTAGGSIKTIGYVYGGQGSLNVPSWSPDSKRIAFISNGIF